MIKKTALYICIVIFVLLSTITMAGIEYKEVAKQGSQYFVYTPATTEADLKWIAMQYKKKAGDVFRVLYFNNEKNAAKKFPMTDANLACWFATYSYNKNTDHESIEFR